MKGRRESKPIIRHASSVMGHIDEIMMEDQTDRALECVSVTSSRFSIPSLHLSNLSIYRTREEDTPLWRHQRDLWTIRDLTLPQRYPSVLYERLPEKLCFSWRVLTWSKQSWMSKNVFLSMVVSRIVSIEREYRTSICDWNDLDNRSQCLRFSEPVNRPLYSSYLC